MAVSSCCESATDHTDSDTEDDNNELGSPQSQQEKQKSSKLENHQNVTEKMQMEMIWMTKLVMD